MGLYRNKMPFKYMSVEFTESVHEHVKSRKGINPPPAKKKTYFKIVLTLIGLSLVGSGNWWYLTRLDPPSLQLAKASPSPPAPRCLPSL